MTATGGEAVPLGGPPLRNTTGTQMNSATLMAAVVAVLLSGCASQARRLDADAHSCERAVREGRLDAAELLCQRALEDADQGVVAPAVRSQRLFALARIKRQRGKFAEARELLAESLAIEETLSGPHSPGVLRRRIEMSVVLAGQGQWQQGAEVLEKTLPIADVLTSSERASLRSIVGHYVLRLNNSGQGAQAAHLAGAAARLSAE